MQAGLGFSGVEVESNAFIFVLEMYSICPCYWAAPAVFPQPQPILSLQPLDISNLDLHLIWHIDTILTQYINFCFFLFSLFQLVQLPIAEYDSTI